MLKAYGVGDEKATVLAATFTWLLKGIYIDLFQLQDNFSPYRTNFKWEMQPERDEGEMQPAHYVYIMLRSLTASLFLSQFLLRWCWDGWENTVHMVKRVC